MPWPRWRYWLPLRLQSLFARDRVESEMAEEMEYHLEQLTAHYQQQGLSHAEARVSAMRDMDGLEQKKEECRDMRSVQVIDSIRQDLQYAFRRVARHPGFAAVAVLLLALGIGANTAIFSLVNAVLLRPLPVEDPDRLVMIYTTDFSSAGPTQTSHPDFEDIRRHASGVFENAGLFRPITVAFQRNGEPDTMQVELATPSYFDTLKARMARGRSFSAKEESPVLVISHRFWQTVLNGDEGVIGRTLTVGGNSFTIIGVAPAEFRSPLRILRIDGWIPTQWASLTPSGTGWIQNRGSRGAFVVARLREGASVQQARQSLAVLAANLHKAYPSNWRNIRNEPRQFILLPESESRIPGGLAMPATVFLMVLLSLVFLLLLIACTNLASLLLAQAAARAQEMSVRLSLGAARRRLVRQLLTEGILVSVGGGLAGIGVAVFLTRLLLLFRPPLPVPLQLDLDLDPRVIAFAFAIAILAGVLMSLAPALYATRQSGIASRFPRVTLRGSLVVAQTAASVVLLISAGLFVRSLLNAYGKPLGFAMDNVALIDIDLSLTNYNRDRGKALYKQILDTIPQSALANEPLMSLQARQRRNLAVEGYSPAPGEDMEFHYNSVTPGFFRLMGVRFLAGREMEANDRNTVVINAAFANRFWPGQNAVGKRLTPGRAPDEMLEIVGIVENAPFVSFSETSIPVVFYAVNDFYSSDMTLYVRGAGSAESVRRQLLQIDRNLPITNSISMSENVATALLPLRMAGTLLGSFGILALVLVAVGISGILAWSVQQRTREIGVRMAMGAANQDILRLIIGQGYRLVVLGAAIGCVLAAAVTRLFGSFLYGVSASDPTTFAGVLLVLGLITLMAAIAPVRRALEVHPSEALRWE